MKQQILWVVEAKSYVGSGVEIRQGFNSRSIARREAKRLRGTSRWTTRIVKYIRSE